MTHDRRRVGWRIEQRGARLGREDIARRHGAFRFTDMTINYSFRPYRNRTRRPQQTRGFCRFDLEGFLARVEPERVALYARVSTHDQQTLPMQLEAMRAYAERKGWRSG